MQSAGSPTRDFRTGGHCGRGAAVAAGADPQSSAMRSLGPARLLLAGCCVRSAWTVLGWRKGFVVCGPWSCASECDGSRLGLWAVAESRMYCSIRCGHAWTANQNSQRAAATPYHSPSRLAQRCAGRCPFPMRPSGRAAR